MFARKKNLSTIETTRKKANKTIQFNIKSTIIKSLSFLFLKQLKCFENILIAFHRKLTPFRYNSTRIIVKAMRISVDQL